MTEYDAIIPISPNNDMLIDIGMSPEGDCVFYGYRRQEDGSQGPAEIGQLVRCEGDLIVAVNGVSTQGKTYKEVLEMLRESCTRRYAMIRFQHGFEKPVQHSASEVMASSSRIMPYELFPANVQKAELKQTVTRLESLVQTKHVQLQESQECIHRIKDELERRCGQMKVMEKSVTGLQEDLCRKHLQLQRLEDRVSQLEIEVARKNEQMETMEATQSAKLHALESKVAQLEKQLSQNSAGPRSTCTEDSHINILGNTHVPLTERTGGIESESATALCGAVAHLAKGGGMDDLPLESSSDDDANLRLVAEKLPLKKRSLSEGKSLVSQKIATSISETSESMPVKPSTSLEDTGTQNKKNEDDTIPGQNGAQKKQIVGAQLSGKKKRKFRSLSEEKEDWIQDAAPPANDQCGAEQAGKKRLDRKRRSLPKPASQDDKQATGVADSCVTKGANHNRSQSGLVTPNGSVVENPNNIANELVEYCANAFERPAADTKKLAPTTRRSAVASKHNGSSINQHGESRPVRKGVHSAASGTRNAKNVGGEPEVVELSERVGDLSKTRKTEREGKQKNDKDSGMGSLAKNVRRSSRNESVISGGNSELLFDDSSDEDDEETRFAAISKISVPKQTVASVGRGATKSSRKGGVKKMPRKESFQQHSTDASLPTVYPVGTAVKKFFKGHGLFYGKIVEVEKDRYKIEYEDGDTEEYLFSEKSGLDKIVVQRDTRKTVRKLIDGIVESAEQDQKRIRKPTQAYGFD